MGTLDSCNPHTFNNFNLRGAIGFAAIAFAMVAILVFGLMINPFELFIAPEYEGVTTELRTDIEPKEYQENSKGLEVVEGVTHNTIFMHTPVKMTGRLFGARGEVSQLLAEVEVPGGEVEWVPLAALLVIK